MKETIGIYGIPSDDIEATRKRVEALLGEKLRGVSSDVWGLYYTSKSWSKYPVVSLYSNFCPCEGDGYWNEPDHKHLPLLLSVEMSVNFDEIHDLVSGDAALGAVLIKRKEFDV